MNMQDFLKELDTMEIENQLSQEGLEFLNQLKEKSNNVFTENGKKILLCMQNNISKYKTFSAKQLGELLFMPPRSVSGSMKKLLNEGYCNKLITSPVTYELTDAGMKIQFD